jgi:hypothetical protein
MHRLFFISVDVIAPMMKWIGKVPPIIGFGGGVGGLTSQYLQRKNKSNEFRTLIEREYGRVFTELNGEQVAFALPKVTVDPTGPRFSTCSNESYEGEAKIPQGKIKFHLVRKQFS